jgi:hypothetical protein
VSPLALFLVVLGMVLIVVAFKGKQNNIIAAFLGHGWQGSSLS